MLSRLVIAFLPRGKGLSISKTNMDRCTNMIYNLLLKLFFKFLGVYMSTYYVLGTMVVPMLGTICFMAYIENCESQNHSAVVKSLTYTVHTS